MSSVKELLLTEVDYSAWADQKLLDACAALSSEELERDLGASHRSILATLRHIFYAERVWCRRLTANPVPPMIEIGKQSLFQDQDPQPGLESLRRSWLEVWRDLREWLENLPEAELAYELCFILPNGDSFRVTRAKILLHAVNHSTLHRGQVMSMLRTLGQQPPNTDIFSFYMLK
jgi:uncharacterized damage-inducible protein DinB